MAISLIVRCHLIASKAIVSLRRRKDTIKLKSTLFITQCATTGVTLTKKSGRRLSASVLIVEINPITLSGSA